MIAALLMVGAFIGLTTHAQSYKDANTQAVYQTYEWFNNISKAPKTYLTRENVAKHFTKDAQMITNNKVICTGVDEHYDHFVELMEHFDEIYVPIDEIMAISHGDMVFLDYALHGKQKDGSNEIIHVMGYMVVKDGKIALFKEVIHH